MGAYSWVIDVVLLLLVLGFTYVVSSEGLWGAALMWVNVMFGGLVAFSLYEPCAAFLDNNVGFMKSFSDMVCLIVLFSIAFTAFRLGSDALGPRMVRFPGWLFHVGRLAFGGATAWYFVGMLLCIAQTAPIHKQFLGYQWERHAFWGLGIDRFWLGFVQATTGRYFEWGRRPGFDRDSSFIVRYHRARPFGDPDTEMPGFRPAPGGGGAAGGAGAPAGGAAGAAQPPGDAGGGRPPVAPPGINLPQ